MTWEVIEFFKCKNHLYLTTEVIYFPQEIIYFTLQDYQ